MNDAWSRCKPGYVYLQTFSHIYKSSRFNFQTSLRRTTINVLVIAFAMPKARALCLRLRESRPRESRLKEIIKMHIYTDRLLQRPFFAFATKEEYTVHRATNTYINISIKHLHFTCRAKTRSHTKLSLSLYSLFFPPFGWKKLAIHHRCISYFDLRPPGGPKKRLHQSHCAKWIPCISVFNIPESIHTEAGAPKGRGVRWWKGT